MALRAMPNDRLAEILAIPAWNPYMVTMWAYSTLGQKHKEVLTKAVYCINVYTIFDLPLKRKYHP